MGLCDEKGERKEVVAYLFPTLLYNITTYSREK